LGGHFDARHDFEAIRRRRTRFVEAGQDVVISYRDRGQATVCRDADDFGR
jgi:hypothetical protein